MAAPLYSRFSRYADREVKRFPRGSQIGEYIKRFKRPGTRVFSLSNNAAYEAGQYSREDPGELMRAMHNCWTPDDQVWIELDWGVLQAGAANAPIDTDMTQFTDSVDWGTGEVRDTSDPPLKIGMMLKMVNRDEPNGTWVDYTLPPDTWVGMLFYLYKSKACFIGPSLSVFCARTSVTGFGAAASGTEQDRLFHITGAGTHYVNGLGKNHPRLMNKMLDHMATILTGSKGMQGVRLAAVDGSARLMLSCLCAALSAKQRVYDPAEDADTIEREDKPRKKCSPKDVVEVDLFLRNYRKPGKSIRASMKAREEIKKGLHKVAAHYAYRAREDGKDPAVCELTEFGHHDWEDIPGTKSQTCILCGQRRWFRDKHMRGDEAYGIVPDKVYNVRAAG